MWQPILFYYGQKFLYSEEEYAFSSVITYEKLKALANIEYDISIHELKALYPDYHRNIAYYVLINRADVYYTSLNLKEINELLIEYIAEQKSNPNNTGINGLKKFLIEKLTSEEQDMADQDQYEQDIEFRAVDDDGEMDESLVNLISDIMANKYSLEELKEMQQNFLANIDVLTSITDTIKHQIDSSDKKEINEKINKEKGIIDLRTLYNKLRETVIDQDRPILRLLTEITRLEKRRGKRWDFINRTNGSRKNLNHEFNCQIY